MKDINTFIKNEIRKTNIKMGVLVLLRLFICIVTAIVFGIIPCLLLVIIVMIDYWALKAYFRLQYFEEELDNVVKKGENRE